MKFTDLDVQLIQLTWVTNRLSAINKKFLEIKGNDENANKFKGVIREYMVIQLHNFIKIRQKLIKNQKVKKIDNCLEPLWDPIMKVKTPIKKLRNKYIAHIQDDEKNPFEVTIHEIIDQYQIPTTFGFWLYLAYCQVCYALLLENNLPDEYAKSQKKYRAKLPVELQYGTITVNNFRQKVIEKINMANDNLKSNKFEIIKKL